MTTRAIWTAVLAVIAAVASHGAAWAQTDPYAADYCEPEAHTKLLYSNRGYLILPKAPDAPALYFSYQILGTQTFVQRRGQFLFDDGDDRWKLESNPGALKLFWPLRPEKKLEIERVDRTNGALSACEDVKHPRLAAGETRGRRARPRLRGPDPRGPGSRNA